MLMRTERPDGLPVFGLVMLHDTRRFVEVFQLVECVVRAVTWRDAQLGLD